MTYKKSQAKLISPFILAVLITLVGSPGNAQTSFDHKPLIHRNILKAEIKNYLNRIQDAYDEIDKYYFNNSKNKIHLEVTGLLRTGSFYVYHLWEMTETKNWLNSQDSDYISRYESDQIKNDFEKFFQKHEKIKSLLSNLSQLLDKNTNSQGVDQLISKLRNFHSLKLFSSLSGSALEPLTTKDVISQVLITKVNPPYDPIDQVSFGESFRVKVIFEKDPGLDTEPVTIRVKPGKLEIQTIAHRTEDPLIYLSKPLQTVHK